MTRHLSFSKLTIIRRGLFAARTSFNHPFRFTRVAKRIRFPALNRAIRVLFEMHRIPQQNPLHALSHPRSQKIKAPLRVPSPFNVGVNTSLDVREH